MTAMLLRMAAAVLLLGGAAMAQEVRSAPAPQQNPQQTPNGQAVSAKPEPKEEPKPPAKQTQEGHRRIFGVIPAYTATDLKNAPPLTPKQKFVLSARQAVDPFEWVFVGIVAGVGQARNSYPEFGQGAEGYGKRYGAAMADQADTNFLSVFLYPTLLKQEPRYFRMGEGSFKHRLGYALKKEFVTRSDRGTRQFNWSSVLGALTAGAISNAYYPPRDRGFGSTMGRAGLGLMYGTLGGLGVEFWPDIQRKLFPGHNKNKISPQADAPADHPCKLEAEPCGPR
ncbi:MAG: hypothetical protein ACE14M_11555 [Terriglobales bacterium]